MPPMVPESFGQIMRTSSSDRMRSRARSLALVRAMPRTIGGTKRSSRVACQLNALRRERGPMLRTEPTALNLGDVSVVTRSVTRGVGSCGYIFSNFLGVIAEIDIWRAAYLMLRCDRGENPLDDRAPAPTVKTVAEVLDDFMSRYARNKDRPLRSADEYERTFNRLVRPAIGKLAIYDPAARTTQRRR
jgi:hypothetical protein